MNFLGAVNRVLVNAFVLKGDDDLITDFNSNQHEATLRVAKNVIQTELNGLLSFFPVDYEKQTGQITTVTLQRTYTLAADFVRFRDVNPFFYLDTDHSDRLFEWNGGELQLKRDDWKYLSTEGDENWWYWDQTTVKSIGMYNIPESGGKIYNYDYERNLSVTNGTDILPFHTEAEAETFADMASRRYVYKTEAGRDVADLQQDNDYMSSYGTLMNFMRHKYPNPHYGYSYR